MDKKKPDIDIVNEILEHCLLAYHHSSFVMSLYQQYQKRSSLSKKQLQGLLGKAREVSEIPPGKLATLEALINKMPNRFKSEAPAAAPLYAQDDAHRRMIDDILQRYPQHKRVLFLKSKFENNEPLNAVELADLKRLQQLLTAKA